MIRETQKGWLKDFLLRLTLENPIDREEVPEIVETFRKLWAVASAAQRNPYPRSPNLEEALSALKRPETGNNMRKSMKT